jgi:alpha-beta hydrolase superfamily lysophospholipase
VQSTGGDVQEPKLEADGAVMQDGAVLPLHRWLPAATPPRATILAVHGLNDHGGSFAEIARYLAERGFAVYAFDQRGFGATEHPGLWAGGDAMADDLRQLARLLRELHPEAPLYGLGESMGGAVLLHALTRHAGDWLDGAAVLAPAVWRRDQMPWYQRFALRLLAHTFRGTRVSGRGLELRASDNPDALRRLDEDPLVIRGTRVDVLWGVANLMDDVTAEAASYGVPLLILYGEHDEIMPRDAMCAWIGSLERNGAWQVAVYPNGWHLLARDLGAAAVHSDLGAWYERPNGALPSRLDVRATQPAICGASPTTGTTKSRPLSSETTESRASG